VGHTQVTQSKKLDDYLGISLANLIGGQSIGWWKKNHNVHHIVTNNPIADPDIQHFPFLAISKDFFNSLTSEYYGKTMKFDRVAKYFFPFY
jgi:delta8-fatty-acid desaturase